MAEATEALVEAKRADAPEREIAKLSSAVKEAEAQRAVRRFEEEMDAMVYEDRISTREFLALAWRHAEQQEELRKRIVRAHLVLMPILSTYNNRHELTLFPDESWGWEEIITNEQSPRAKPYAGVESLPDDAGNRESVMRVPAGGNTIFMSECLEEDRAESSDYRSWLSLPGKWYAPTEAENESQEPKSNEPPVGP